MNLKSQYNQLSALAAKADDYTKKTKDMSDAMQQVYDNFPSYLQIENGIMDAVAIEIYQYKYYRAYSRFTDSY